MPGETPFAATYDEPPKPAPEPSTAPPLNVQTVVQQVWSILQNLNAERKGKETK